MSRLCPWKPHVKKGNVEDRHLRKIPQYVGNPGWILLTHSETGTPLALFVDKQETVTSLPIVLDERVFSDTVIRVTQLKPNVFVACDLRYLNGTFLYATLSYADRYKKLEEVLDAFHRTDLTALLPYDEVPLDSLVHGWEQYDDMPGSMGVFLPARE
jgi:hypothetical protein